MKKIILVILSCSWLVFTYAADCGFNSEGNKYCSYDNGCYEYWNKNGTHYSSCDKQEQNNSALIEMIKKDMNSRANLSEEESYNSRITPEQEALNQEEAELATKQWIEKKIKDQEAAHVMSFGEIVFYIIVAFVFTIVVIMPAKDAFWPKK